MVEYLQNSGDPYQTPRSAAPDLGLHCLPNTLLGVSTLEWVKGEIFDRVNSCQDGSKMAMSSAAILLFMSVFATVSL